MSIQSSFKWIWYVRCILRHGNEMAHGLVKRSFRVFEVPPITHLPLRVRELSQVPAAKKIWGQKHFPPPPFLLFSSSVVKLNFYIWELRYGGLLRVILVSLLRGSHVGGLPFPAPLINGFARPLFFPISCVLSERGGAVESMLHEYELWR